ncbi:SIMPL domain-containing protein [Lacinutrix sp. Hel_I_90]|uniref:SIMPL domain-containing protein n=1 Tax=Lacinutrix sp. Hel_I_90 TaxID=1249999 RepID=UPI0005C8ADEB|nr:SIMPL domain-containing protein [Lacinutrix sp. Hel_I_90]
MKLKFYVLLVLLSTFASAQIKGNAPAVYGQNVMSSADLGNAQVYGATTAFRQQQLVPNANITIDVKALNNVVADAYTAVFNLVQIGETSQDTNTLMNERVNKVKTELITHGINSNDIVIDVISFVPVYETVVEKKLFSKKYNEVPVGFELQQNIHVKFSKVNQFEKILSACANNEIYNLVKVDYFIEDIKAVYTNLRAEILKVLKEKQQFYKDLGFDLTDYKPIIADTKYCYFPKEFYKHYEAFACTSLEAIKKNQGVLSAEKQISYYYDPLSFKAYDVVLNAAIVEPVIQVGMEIKLQYAERPKEEAPKEKEVIKNKFFMVSDEGTINVKELKLEN